MISRFIRSWSVLTVLLCICSKLKWMIYSCSSHYVHIIKAHRITKRFKCIFFSITIITALRPYTFLMWGEHLNISQLFLISILNHRVQLQRFRIKDAFCISTNIQEGDNVCTISLPHSWELCNNFRLVMRLVKKVPSATASWNKLIKIWKSIALVQPSPNSFLHK